MNTLICLEGVSYAGKTTIAKWLTERMPVSYGPRVASGWEEREEKVHRMCGAMPSPRNPALTATSL